MERKNIIKALVLSAAFIGSMQAADAGYVAQAKDLAMRAGVAGRTYVMRRPAATAATVVAVAGSLATAQAVGTNLALPAATLALGGGMLATSTGLVAAAAYGAVRFYQAHAAAVEAARVAAVEAAREAARVAREAHEEPALVAKRAAEMSARDARASKRRRA